MKLLCISESVPSKLFKAVSLLRRYKSKYPVQKAAYEFEIDPKLLGKAYRDGFINSADSAIVYLHWYNNYKDRVDFQTYLNSTNK